MAYTNGNITEEITHSRGSREGLISHYLSFSSLQTSYPKESKKKSRTIASNNM
jgi:hypothetical protein